MQALYDVPAPAKLNLFLHITGRRSDGYHLMHRCSCCWTGMTHCTLNAFRRGDISRIDLGSTESADALPDEDPTIRAARLPQQATGCTQGARISLLKRLPSQAGMGGGRRRCDLPPGTQSPVGHRAVTRSADEAGLATGCRRPFPVWGQRLGRRHRGGTSTDFSTSTELLGGQASGRLPTARIFTDPNLSRSTKPATMQGFAEHSASNQTIFGWNDLQPVAQMLCPEITACIDWLKDQHLDARMTGSGSAVFAPVQDCKQVLKR